MGSFIQWIGCLSLPALFACSVDGLDGSRERVTGERAPIIGGVADLARSYVVGVGDSDYVFCTGTVISRRTVVTAGHCYGGIRRVYFGPNIASSAGPTSVEVVREVRDPQFDEAKLSHDLTLLELAAPAPTEPAPLLRETMDETFIGPRFTFVGYGDDGQKHYDVRRVATFPIAAIGPADVGRGTGSGPIDETMFYYAIPDKNTCSGDSGGPAFVVRQRVERVAGATSYGDRGCTEDGVDSRTDAPAVAAFIQPMIDAFEGADPCRADGHCDETCNVNHTLVDPDCAEAHCGADGMCVLSCVDPVDPDCTGVDHCVADGVCDPRCPEHDADCDAPAPPDGGAPDSGVSSSSSSSSGSSGSSGAGGGSDSGSGGAGGSGGASSASSASATASSGGGSGASTGAGHIDGAPQGAVESSGAAQQGGSCGCRAAGSEVETEGPLGLGLSIGALFLWRRRRAQGQAPRGGLATGAPRPCSPR